jgi:hypothetical protein
VYLLRETSYNNQHQAQPLRGLDLRCGASRLPYGPCAGRYMAKVMKRVLIFLVICFSQIVFAGEWIEVEGGAVDVDLRQVEVEEGLWKFLADQKEYQFKERSRYIYQYQAVESEIIQINGLCHVFDRSKLSSEFYHVFDGGSCFFQVQYDIKTGKFKNLYVNGLA